MPSIAIRSGGSSAPVHENPRRLHERCIEFARRETLEYITPEQQSYVRAKLLEQIGSIDAAAAERERRALARAIENPKTRQVFSQIVEVVDEPAAEYPPLPPEAQTPVTHETAVGKRKDAHIKTPRARDKKQPLPAKMRRTSAATADAVARVATVSAAASPHVVPAQATTTITGRKGVLGNDTQHSATKRPSDGGPRRAPSRLKWGDDF